MLAVEKKIGTELDHIKTQHVQKESSNYALWFQSYGLATVFGNLAQEAPKFRDHSPFFQELC